MPAQASDTGLPFETHRDPMHRGPGRNLPDDAITQPRIVLRHQEWIPLRSIARLADPRLPLQDPNLPRLRNARSMRRHHDDDQAADKATGKDQTDHRKEFKTALELAPVVNPVPPPLSPGTPKAKLALAQ